jgi:N-acetyl-anhydromuramyl-L-alanine amidase AmpD
MLNDSRVTPERHSNIERGELKVIRGIIVHQTGGASAQSTLGGYRAKNGNGAHFLIDKDGTIYQTASLYCQTAHVGKLRARCVAEHSCSPVDVKALKVFSPRRENAREMEKLVPERYPANADSIGIELVGMPDANGVYESASPEQNASLKWLVDTLLNAFRVSSSEVFRHPTVSRKTESEAASARW